ncbi:hypothetical protein N7448_000108 [Penicillium atrosanguineum]|uniref:Sulfotransferase family protein n=1 Tax=Penicillium atrosanguineum TaxID=1132637 RepID=A0A9W9LC94_9EURO|nr:Amino acid/polyamine transporter I [Penicillium atrosanguineum]KAJ5134869.1 hypothetical protein N7526_006234 [Penicillium atrosanguineum]KAJ5148530.1 hypothetical protein N7448_000108 [Penicillium atrosanguineum]KAJ5303849.1 Amino acid/polyamine transporter I [Penicillium atrosanguineum]KAJ5323324.1 hypothetical protein N7476_001924 [Penicillium atrosanguineum]
MSRLIDKEPLPTHQKPLRVVVAGLSRTGTASLYVALQELGFTPWHMCEPIDDPRQMYNQWTEAMNCRFFNQGRHYDRDDFDRLRGKYDALLDIPASLFWEDLRRLYPEAKIILTTRSADSWFQSVHNTIIPWLEKPILNVLQFVEPRRLRPELRMVKTAYKVICNNDYRSDSLRQRFLDHNNRVRFGVQSESFLEMQLGDGWEPLCAFLRVPVPDKPYPKINNTNEFNQGASEADAAILGGLLRPWLAAIVPIAVAAWWLLA